MRTSFFIFLIIIIGAAGALWYFQSRQFPIPTGETKPLVTEEVAEDNASDNVSAPSPSTDASQINTMTTREISVTDGVKHSIPLNEILSGGPGKDGIPSIDNPEFVSAEKATFLDDSDSGLGLT